MPVKAKVGMYQLTVVPTLLYGSGEWMSNANKRKNVEAVEMNCGITSIVITRYVEVYKCKMVSIGEGIDRNVSKCFSNVESMEDDSLMKRCTNGSI